eukprot:CAMPEP_0201552730 /NCGR_PEP_ID=MMETSP0173_2-20130828/17133_1 /ASSEMBLY_ACC=CAM_ASM_000268 /TAXON_ID=218659 /ORGANISM="Vexillifera sp., Strain DIVA3 564/2" /LENGTH=477 /DNA_ID=CAMNT_0047963255 /DNA_START=5 /DNA_END=1435 /DNA_ORIENTATION=+
MSQSEFEKREEERLLRTINRRAGKPLPKRTKPKVVSEPQTKRNRFCTECGKTIEATTSLKMKCAQCVSTPINRDLEAEKERQRRDIEEQRRKDEEARKEREAQLKAQDAYWKQTELPRIAGTTQTTSSMPTSSSPTPVQKNQEDDILSKLLSTAADLEHTLDRNEQPKVTPASTSSAVGKTSSDPVSHLLDRSKKLASLQHIERQVSDAQKRSSSAQHHQQQLSAMNKLIATLPRPVPKEASLRDHLTVISAVCKALNAVGSDWDSAKVDPFVQGVAKFRDTCSTLVEHLHEIGASDLSRTLMHAAMDFLKTGNALVDIANKTPLEHQRSASSSAFTQARQTFVDGITQITQKIVEISREAINIEQEYEKNKVFADAHANIVQAVRDAALASQKLISAANASPFNAQTFQNELTALAKHIKATILSDNQLAQRDSVVQALTKTLKAGKDYLNSPNTSFQVLVITNITHLLDVIVPLA